MHRASAEPRSNNQYPETLTGALTMMPLKKLKPFFDVLNEILDQDEASRVASRMANAAYRRKRVAGVVLVSDNESWIGSGRHGSTAVMTEWQQFVANQVRLNDSKYAGPKLVCIDLQPHGTVQAPERSDILNIGGFSDAVFSVVSAFLSDDASRFVADVEAIEL